MNNRLFAIAAIAAGALSQQPVNAEALNPTELYEWPIAYGSPVMAPDFSRARYLLVTETAETDGRETRRVVYEYDQLLRPLGKTVERLENPGWVVSQTEGGGWKWDDAGRCLYNRSGGTVRKYSYDEHGRLTTYVEITLHDYTEEEPYRRVTTDFEYDGYGRILSRTAVTDSRAGTEPSGEARYNMSGNREVFTYGDGYPAITGPVGKETYQFGTISHRSDKWALDSKQVSTWTVVDGVRHELRMEHAWDEDLEEVVPVWVYECDYPTLGDMIGGKTCRTARYHIGSDGSAGRLANETTQSALAEGGLLTVTDLKTTYDYDQSATLTAMRQERETRRYVYDGTDVYGTLVYWTEEEYEPETETWVLRSKSVTELDDATGQTLLATTVNYDGGIPRYTSRSEYAYDQLGRRETYVSYYGYGTEPNPSMRKESEYEGEWSHPCRETSYRYDRDAGEWAKSEVAEWEYDYGVSAGEVASYNSSLQAGCPYLCRMNKTMSYNGADTPASVTTVRYGYSELSGDSGIGSVASGHASGERAVEVYSLAGIRLGRYPSLGEARLPSGLYIAVSGGQARKVVVR